jgi:hypothetical protein
MADDKYNGFTNYETWVTVLWLENESRLQHEVEFRANSVHEFYGSSKERDDYFEGWVVSSLADTKVWDSDFPISIKDKELMRKDMGSTWRINWKEVVDRFIEEGKLKEDYETWRSLHDTCCAVYRDVEEVFGEVPGWRLT